MNLLDDLASRLGPQTHSHPAHLVRIHHFENCVEVSLCHQGRLNPYSINTGRYLTLECGLDDRGEYYAVMLEL